MQKIYKRKIIESQIIIPLLFSIICCILLVALGSTVSYKISYIIVLVILFLMFYFTNIRNSYKIFFMIVPLIPMYLAIDINPSLPLISAYRLLYMLFIIDQLIIKKKMNILIESVKRDKFNKFVFFYVIGIFISTMFNFNKTSVVNLVSIIIEQVLLYYIIRINLYKEEVIKSIIDIVIKVSLLLSILGIMEYITSFNIFSLLDTSQRVISSYYIRMGSLRVSTSFKHSLGYGLYLVLFIPIVLYRLNTLKQNRKNLRYLRTIITFILMNINVMLTSSRSTLLVLLLQYLIIFIMLNWKKKIVTIIITSIIAGSMIILSISPVAEGMFGISIVSQSIKSLSNTFIGNNSDETFGENSEPFTYRKELIKYSFNKKGKDFLVGEGLGFIRENPLVFNLPELNKWEPIVSYSVDNYYVLKFLELGIMGLIPMTILFGAFTINMFLNRKKSYLSKMLLISTIGYFLHLFMVDELETIKYLWILFAIFSSHLKYINEHRLSKVKN